MAFDFPDNPALGQEVTFPADNAIYIWNGVAWDRKADVTDVGEPPANNIPYARIVDSVTGLGAWVPIADYITDYIFGPGLKLQADGVTVNLELATPTKIGGIVDTPPDNISYARITALATGIPGWTPVETISPILYNIYPSCAAINTPTTLKAFGAYYTVNSEILLGGAPIPTTFISVEELRGDLPAYADPTTAWEITIQTDSMTSLGKTFRAVNIPTVTSIAPTTAGAGDPTFALAITGTNFYDEAAPSPAVSVVQFDGVVIGTAFFNANSLSVQISPTTTTPGAHTVQVFTGDLEASTAPFTFTIT